MIFGAATALVALLTGPLPAADIPLPRTVVGSDELILSKATPWRWHVAWRSPDVLSADPQSTPGAPREPETLKPKRSFDEETDTERIAYPPPAVGWADTGFDDADWPRDRLPVRPGGGHMGPFHVSAGLLSIRGRFTVEDPDAVKELVLSFAYRGGAVVYLNGREVARCDLPKGQLTPATPGSPYPDEAWVDADGKPLPRPSRMNAEQKQRAAARERQFGPGRLPLDALRKGLNVLAVEVHRSDYHPSAKTWWRDRNFMYGAFRGWVPLGLSDVRLQAVGSGCTANTDRPSGFQVWVPDVADRLDRVDYPDPSDGAASIVIPAARNGQFSGAVAVSATRRITGLKVTAGDLARKGGGGMIPASAVRVRYALKAHLPETVARYRASKAFDALMDAPPPEIAANGTSKSAAALAWVTVLVPKDPAARQYEGKVTVALAGRPAVELPLKLSVADWTLPDPRAFRTVVNIYQSPSTLAELYKVEEWSEEHWKLMDKSFELLAPFGCDLVNLPVVDRTQFGNDEGMVYWVRRPGGSYGYDFRVFDRYVRMVKKHLGTPPFISLQVWHGCGYDTPNAAKQKNTVTVIDPATQAREHLQVPEFGTERAREFWAPVLTAIRQRLAKEGLEGSMCLGILSDGRGPAAMHKMFADILPQVRWTRGCHFSTYDTKPSPLPGGGKIVCHEFCYGSGVADPGKKVPRIWDYPTRPGIDYKRGHRDWSPLETLRMAAQMALLKRTRGIGRICLDYWSLPRKVGNRTISYRLFNRWPHSSCAQRQPTIWALAYPGSDGAGQTLRLQTLLEGVQEAEALICVTEAAHTQADKLGPDLTARCKAFFMATIQEGRQHYYSPRNRAGWRGRTAQLYALAAEVAERPKQE
jgi:hypothetical protein